ncbi:tyrosinase family protein [Tenacibaculum ovolyticum]|uniref:tyrosinase family protein n=1 Tax=Tenacibaculum ovolyticum TaxID=104270 RepID=UPI0022F3E546|nr:tyrosinase family protein [Tenacibaculum ovolyticum]WBX74895.1 tyrosinase family protein [Tenacibaculum ovolyticum]
MKNIILLLSIFLVTSLCYSQNENNAKYVRLNASTPEAQADLEAMNVAFKKMREMDCENGLAWYYQGAIHNIPSEIKGKNNLCSQYQTSKDKLFAWGDCTHKSGISAKLHFLLWHRMYIWHFEKIIRELSGKKDFALPYWNYGSNILDENIMPQKIRDPKGYLYEAARYSVLNNGEPIPPTNLKNIKRTLREIINSPIFLRERTNEDGEKEYFGFSPELEKSPHGYMHDLIGGEYANPKETFYNQIYQKKDFPGLMANVPSAGFDSVFWLHHSMIDRIWESWEVNHLEQRPTLAQLEASPWEYNFIEPNGKEITYTIKEMYDIVFNLGYRYNNLLYTSESPVLASIKPSVNKNVSFQDSTHKIIWKQKIGKTIGSNAFKHKVTKKISKRVTKNFKSEKKSFIFLSLNVVVYKEPSDYYTVHLRYPNQKDEYLGTMTFFGVAHDHGTGENHTIGENGVKLNFSYYISDDLKDSNKNFEIIIKKNGIGEAKVTLENISMIKFN